MFEAGKEAARIEDKKIVALFFQRSEHAISELDKKYGALCRRLAFQIIGSRQDAEECVNDAYLGAWRAIPPVEPDPLPAFVCKIVRNLSVKRYQSNQAAKRKSAYTVSLQELESCLPAPCTVEAELAAKDVAHMLDAFLSGLSEENRVIFLLRYWFSFSYKDISRRVGLTEKNVSVRLTRLRRALRSYLREREVFS